MDGTYPFSRLRYALKQLAVGELLGDKCLNLKDVYVYLWLVINRGTRLKDVSVTDGQGSLAAQLEMSEPTLSASLNKLASVKLLAEMRINKNAVKEFVIPGGASVDDPSPGRRSDVAAQILSGLPGEALRKDARVVLALILYMSNGVGLLVGRSDKEIGELLGVRAEKLGQILSYLKAQGFLTFTKESTRGAIDGSRLIIKLKFTMLLDLGWFDYGDVVRLWEYAPDGCNSSYEGVAKYIRHLTATTSPDGEGSMSPERYSFGKSYLVDCPRLWPKGIDLYFQEKSLGWRDRYLDKFMYSPEDVLRCINDFEGVLLDELFLSLPGKILEKYQALILYPNDDVLAYASFLVRNELGSIFLKKGYSEEGNSWVVTEVAICLIRQAQRGRLILEYALGWELGEERADLQCVRLSYRGKLNSYEVNWVVCHRLSEKYDRVRYVSLEIPESSLVKIES